MQESGLTETIPSIGTSAIWGQHPVTLTLSLLGVQHWGEGWGEWLAAGADAKHPVSMSFLRQDGCNVMV